jgi:MoaA/NifB/PqqE/SkfB family radical SAM enzyme
MPGRKVFKFGDTSQHDSVPHERKSFQVKIDQEGRLSIDSAQVRNLGFEPGAEAEVIVDGSRVEIPPNIHSLARVYIEPTTRCNLACNMCIRNTWQEPIRDMDAAVFKRLVSQLRRFERLNSVMFGGFGEPTAHPDILDMIRSVNDLGVKVELVTNGTCLSEAMVLGLMQAGLDMIWVSVDGLSEASLHNSRPGASFKNIVASLQFLRELNRASENKIEVGIAFVLMRRNIEDLKKLERLPARTGARFVSVSNVIPYSAEMEQEMICKSVLTNISGQTPGRININLPRLDFNEMTREAIFRLWRSYEDLTVMGNPVRPQTESCTFIKNRCTFIRCDGKVSPCMGLLHSHRIYLHGLERKVTELTLGNVVSGNLCDIWNSSEYRRFREKVRKFHFSPCYACDPCSFFEKNEEDCSGNTFPTCGGCLWAQGIIQCP